MILQKCWSLGPAALQANLACIFFPKFQIQCCHPPKRIFPDISVALNQLLVKTRGPLTFSARGPHQITSMVSKARREKINLNLNKYIRDGRKMNE